MSTVKKYQLNGWANLCKDGFSMSFTQGGNEWSKKITKNKEITIIIGSHKYKYKSNNGFSLRKIMGFINDAYFENNKEYKDGDDDMISNISLTAFTIDEDNIVRATYNI